MSAMEMSVISYERKSLNKFNGDFNHFQSHFIFGILIFSHLMTTGFDHRWTVFIIYDRFVVIYISRRRTVHWMVVYTVFRVHSD